MEINKNQKRALFVILAVAVVLLILLLVYFSQNSSPPATGSPSANSACLSETKDWCMVASGACMPDASGVTPVTVDPSCLQDLGRIALRYGGGATNLKLVSGKTISAVNVDPQKAAAAMEEVMAKLRTCAEGKDAIVLMEEVPPLQNSPAGTVFFVYSGKLDFSRTDKKFKREIKIYLPTSTVEGTTDDFKKRCAKATGEPEDLPEDTNAFGDRLLLP